MEVMMHATRRAYWDLLKDLLDVYDHKMLIHAARLEIRRAVEANRLRDG